MSVSGISATGLAAAGSQATPGKGAQVYSEALQLGRDLYAGNLSAVQSDYATLQKLVPDASSASAQANNPYAKDLTEIGTDLQVGNLSGARQIYAQVRDVIHPEAVHKQFQQLGTDLQSGNLSTAQADYSQLKQILPETNSPSTAQNPALAAAFNQIGTDLQAGNLPAAQQVYGQIQQAFQLEGQSVSLNSAQTTAILTGVSVEG